jgi:four helix bundle protein
VSRAQADVPLFEHYRETRPHVDQLLRAVGAISANLEEGYGRSGAADRAHFYEYALSTAREARGWYFKCASALPAETLSLRLSVFTQIIRLLTKTVPEVRASKTRWRPRRDPDVKPLPDPNE